MSNKDYLREKRREALEKICEAWHHDLSCFICGRTEEELAKDNKKLQIEHFGENTGKKLIQKSEGGASNTYEVLNTPDYEIRDNFDILCDDCNAYKNGIIRELMIYVRKLDFEGFYKRYESFLETIPEEILYKSIILTAEKSGYKIDFNSRRIIEI